MKMSVSISALLGVATKAKAIDVLQDLEKVLASHKCTDVHVTVGLAGGDDTTKGKTDNDQHQQAGAVRSERGQAAADDFADDEAPAEPEGKPAGRKPRSDAGKPRGKRGAAAGEADGSPAEGPERPGAGEAEAGGHGRRRAPEGGKRGEREASDAGGRSGRGGGRSGDVHGRDGKAAEVAADEEDWGSADEPAPEDDGEDAFDFTNKPAEKDPEFDSFEEGEAWWAKTPDTDGWPDSLMPEGPINRGVLSTIMSDHFRANGGKSRQATFDILTHVTDAPNLNEVHADDFDKLARALLRDTAKLRHGVKKPGAK